MRQQPAARDDAPLGFGISIEEVFQLPDWRNRRLAPPGNQDGQLQAGERVGNVEVEPPPDERRGRVLATLLMRGGVVVGHHIGGNNFRVDIGLALQEAAQARLRSQRVEDAIAHHRTT